jgi:hypothetical protein
MSNAASSFSAAAHDHALAVLEQQVERIAMRHHFCSVEGRTTVGRNGRELNFSSRSASPTRCRNRPVKVLKSASLGAAVPVPLGRSTHNFNF